MEKTYQRINWENEPSTVTPLNEDNLNRIDYAVDVIDTRVVELGSYRDEVIESAESARENAILSQSYAVGGTNERVGENVDNAKYYKEQAESASRNVESAVVEVNTAVSSATVSARNAKESEDNSKISETNAKDSENKAKDSENNAKTSEDNAKTSEDNAKTSEDQCNSASEIAQNAVTSISSYMETIETAVESASASADRAQEIADSIDYDYTNMRNKPSINGHELVGNLTTEDLDISAEPEGYSELVTTVGTHTTEISTLSQNVTQLNDDLTQTMSDVSAHDTAIADLTVEQSTQASNISNLDIEVAKKANSSSLAKVATSGSYNDLSNKPTIPTVNNGTLTIQKNGSNVATFTANQSGNATANITVPNVVNNLTTSATGSALDASQGKTLSDKIAGKQDKLVNRPFYQTIRANASSYTFDIAETGLYWQSFVCHASNGGWSGNDNAPYYEINVFTNGSNYVLAGYKKIIDNNNSSYSNGNISSVTVSGTKITINFSGTIYGAVTLMNL